MKNTTLMMCFIAALAIFTLPVDAAPFSQSIPITLSVPVPCNNVGEVVDLSGRVHAVITSRHGLARLHVNAQGIAGTGEITGRTFQANGQFDMIFRGFVGMSRTRAEFIEVTGAPEPDGNVPIFWLQADVRVTFHPNGAVTVKFNNFTVDCSGDGVGLWDY